MSEERYYIAEYTMNERAAGLHLPALAFAHETRSERDTHSEVGCCARPATLRHVFLRNNSTHSRTGLLPPQELVAAAGGAAVRPVQVIAPGVLLPACPGSQMATAAITAADLQGSADVEAGHDRLDSLYGVAAKCDTATLTAG